MSYTFVEITQNLSLLTSVSHLQHNGYGVPRVGWDSAGTGWDTFGDAPISDSVLCGQRRDSFGH